MSKHGTCRTGMAHLRPMRVSPPPPFSFIHRTGVRDQGAKRGSSGNSCRVDGRRRVVALAWLSLAIGHRNPAPFVRSLPCPGSPCFPPDDQQLGSSPRSYRVGPSRPAAFLWFAAPTRPGRGDGEVDGIADGRAGVFFCAQRTMGSVEMGPWYGGPGFSHGAGCKQRGHLHESTRAIGCYRLRYRKPNRLRRHARARGFAGRLQHPQLRVREAQGNRVSRVSILLRVAGIFLLALQSM